MRSAACCTAALLACAGLARSQVALDRADYESRLHAMWQALCIANWTGIRGEGQRINPPFPTDADWGTDLGRGVLEYVFQNPWGADDDSDIEYVALSLLTHDGILPSPGAWRQAWTDHVNRFIWVSNAEARDLMDRGVRPPGTGLASANRYWLHIDAQLTTEIFGALAPGLPGVALDIADLPISITARGHAAHAAQFHVALYALAATVDRQAPRPAALLDLVQRAALVLPATSKARDVITFVVDDYLANPDLDNWELTRDRLYERYQRDDVLYGFKYRGWTESSVNLGTGVLCLLYGQGDLARTIRIGTLSGWDADNGTATMGGLLGLVYGPAILAEAFPGVSISDRYWISRTRDAMPDYMPDDPGAEDTFTLLASRMLPLVDQSVARAGGIVDPFGTGWLLPGASISPALNPRSRLDARSVTLSAIRAGLTPTGASSVASQAPSGRGVRSPDAFASGFHLDASGRDVLADGDRRFYSTENASLPAGDEIALSLVLPEENPTDSVIFIEGDHYPEGGWFETLRVEVLAGGVWSAAAGTWSEPLSAEQPFQFIEFRFAGVTPCSGVRLVGLPGGAGRFVTASAIDLLTPAIPAPIRGFDVNRDARVDVEDLYSWHRTPVDVTCDGVADQGDRESLEQAVRWQEIRDMSRPQRP